MDFDDFLENFGKFIQETKHGQSPTDITSKKKSKLITLNLKLEANTPVPNTSDPESDLKINPSSIENLYKPELCPLDLDYNKLTTPGRIYTPGNMRIDEVVSFEEMSSGGSNRDKNSPLLQAMHGHSMNLNSMSLNSIQLQDNTSVQSPGQFLPSGFLPKSILTQEKLSAEPSEVVSSCKNITSNDKTPQISSGITTKKATRENVQVNKFTPVYEILDENSVLSRIGNSKSVLYFKAKKFSVITLYLEHLEFALNNHTLFYTIYEPESLPNNSVIMYVNGRKRVELEIPDQDLSAEQNSKMMPESSTDDQPARPKRENFASINDRMEGSVFGKSMAREVRNTSVMSPSQGATVEKIPDSIGMMMGSDKKVVRGQKGQFRSPANSNKKEIKNE
jgi:hypothetical protein